MGFASGCVQTHDPAIPCGAIELGEAEPGVVAAHHFDAPVLAVADDPEPFVLHWVCADGSDDDCSLHRTWLADLDGGVTPGSEVLVTAAGHWVVAIDHKSGAVVSYAVTRQGITPRDPYNRAEDRPAQLVASLRGSDVVLVRDARGALRRYVPGDHHADRIAPEIPNLKVVALGEKFLVGREILGDDEETLHLVPVDPSLDLKVTGPVALVRGRTFSRVTLTAGDDLVLATSGQGDDAETFVFTVPDGQLVDRFMGAMVSGRRRHDEIAGMRAVSPDGSHVVYRTASGAAAMRDLHRHASCLVRSAIAGNHSIIGFSAHGLVYMESEAGAGESQIVAWNPSTRHLAELGRLDAGYRLAAVPTRDPETTDRPWAIGVRSGSYSALQEHAPPQNLGLDDPVFMPRDTPGIWVINTDLERNRRRVMTLARVDPLVSTATRSYRFPSGDEAEVPFVEHDAEAQAFRHELGGHRVCMSTGTPGDWASQCGDPANGKFLSGSPIPASEDDALPDRQPELPRPEDE